MSKLIRSTDRRASDANTDRGFTLVEILIAIVLVGILSAVVVVGISNLTAKGSKSACTASLDASKAATVVYYATTGAYPATFNALVTGAGGQQSALTLPSGVTASADGMSVAAGSTWTLTMTPHGTDVPTFACS
jgi:prepilin-type N-terminal cleavage/methylation domain-containing protein